MLPGYVNKITKPLTTDVLISSINNSKFSCCYVYLTAVLAKSKDLKIDKQNSLFLNFPLTPIHARRSTPKKN